MSCLKKKIFSASRAVPAFVCGTALFLSLVMVRHTAYGREGGFAPADWRTTLAARDAGASGQPDPLPVQERGPQPAPEEQTAPQPASDANSQGARQENGTEPAPEGTRPPEQAGTSAPVQEAGPPEQAGEPAQPVQERQPQAAGQREEPGSAPRTEAIPLDAPAKQQPVPATEAVPREDAPAKQQPAPDTEAIPQDAPAGQQPMPDTEAAPQEDASVRQLPTPGEELAALREVFQNQVIQATLDRIDGYETKWSGKPQLRQVFEERHERLATLPEAYYDFVRKDVAERMSKAGLSFDGTQYFVYADRNPYAQFILVGLYEADTDSIEFLGADLVSTGNIEKGSDYFETPTGVFENLVANFSYRALGTPNQEGWRGLGGKDSRVWDFGDQPGLKQYRTRTGSTMSQMRLLMHATDPSQGEPRLGRTDSKGCVRISPGLNQFLDSYAILDRNYEEWRKNRHDSWLLKKERTPVAYPGKYLIIGDSQTTGFFAPTEQTAAPKPRHAARAARNPEAAPAFAPGQVHSYQ